MKTLRQSLKSMAVCALVACGFAGSAFADWTFNNNTLIEDVEGGWQFRCARSGAAITISGVVSSSTVSSIVDFTAPITIPNVEGGFVKALANNALKGNGTVSRIILPEGLTSIGEFALYGCAELTSVILPQSSLTTIGQQAFAGNSKLVEILPCFPDSVTSFGYAVLQNTPLLRGTVRLGYGTTFSFGTGSYSWGKQFQSCGLDELDLGPATREIRDYCADSCANLTNVIFTASGVTSLGRNAFSNCPKLRTITPLLPDTVTSVGFQALYNSPLLGGTFRVGYAATLSFGTGDYSRGQQLARTSIEKIDLGPAATSVPLWFTAGSESANDGLATLKEVKWSDNLTTLGRWSFGYCTNLTTVTPLLPTNCTSVGPYAFKGCYNLKGKAVLGMGGAVTFVGGANSVSETFLGSGIEEIEFGLGVTSVGSYICQDCASLTNVTFSGDEATTVSLGNSAFKNCSRLKTIKAGPLLNFQAATYNTLANTAPDYQGQILYHKENAAWGTWIASLGANFKEWSEEDGAVTDTEKGYYALYFPDGETPRGYYALNSLKKWFVPYSTAVVGAKNLIVDAEPYEVGIVSPAYGDCGQVTPPVACTASTYGERSDVAYRIAGARLDRMGEIDWEIGEMVADDDNYSFNPEEPGTYRLMWQWADAAYALKLNQPDPALGHVEVSGTELDAPTLAGTYYVSNTVVTLTLTTEPDTKFVRWCGDVDESEAASKTVHVTMDGIRKAAPYFELPWTYDSTAKTISDGYWTLSVSGDVSALKITKVSARDSIVSVLDLRKATDGCAIAEIDASVFNGNTVLTEVRLPETLTTIGRQAFLNCSNLKTVTPFLPDSVISVGYQAFSGCPVEGELRLGFGEPLTLVVGDYNYGYNFSGIRVGRIVAGPALVTIPPYAFYSNPNLTNVVFAEEGLVSIGRNAFESDTSLASVSPLLPKTVTTVNYRAFLNCPIKGTLELGFGDTLSLGTGDYSWGHQFNGTMIDTLVAGPALISLPKEFMNNAKVLETLDLTRASGLTSIGQDAFKNDSALLNVYLNAYPSFGTTVFSGVPSTARFFLSREATGWNAWLSDTANATAWTNLTTAAQKVYFDAWGQGAKHPKARAVKANSPFPKDSWLLRYTATSGMKILFR